MADKFDPYRERLIMETETIWPPEFSSVPDDKKLQIEAKLHASPDQCAELAYVRVHTGFCRSITVTQGDLDRLAS